ncbi:hypothetical protein C0991_000336 [Blastosporella zonata]|nr:hypothetical protein C0991_000336 [Blastosporella zonata]
MTAPAAFTSNLCTFSTNTITNLQYAGLTRDKPLSREALQVAAGLFDMWDNHPKRLQDKEWDQVEAVMAGFVDGLELEGVGARNALLQVFLGNFKAMVPGQRSGTLANINMGDTQEMPLFEEDNKDFETLPVRKPWASSKSLGKRKAGAILGRVNMDSGPSNARPSKVSKMGSRQPSTKQARPLVDILDAHPTEKDSIDKGLEGEIVVWVGWTTRAIVKLALHSERVEFWEVKGPEGPTAGALSEILAVLPTLGAEGDKEEILGEGISGEPKLEEKDDGALAAPEGSEGPGDSESAKLVCWLTDEPTSEFERLTCRVGDLQEMEASMTGYTNA